MTAVVLEHRCASCGRPIVVGRLLPWTHAAGRVGNPHYARPLRSGEPTTNRSATPRVGRSALVGSSEGRDKALNPASPLRGT